MDVKTIVPEDMRDRMKVTLRGKNSTEDIKHGDFVIVQNVVVSEYHHQKKQLSTTSRSIVKVLFVFYDNHQQFGFSHTEYKDAP